ncbi:fatty-acid peroxygenase [Marinilactibacillus piezotolerans]|uniref:Fatty-acid peroxygenase n=1 Tax=Marinilactibacillus piezotolerans TaxID=258723 RepID=A0A1I3VTG2_9LACT|nr:cytochrome P450 [Marinilactibacillus piezotolerans]SFJ98440.1 fatty-acid peroxygenase [Marinilactibacillus piezotolerans]
MQKVKPFPREKGIENGLRLLREGYLYIPNRRKAYQSDAVKTRVLGQEAILLGGEEAAELFYDEDKFKREGAAPEPAVSTLLGQGGVQQLDDEAHRHRKKMFLDLMSKERIEIWAKLVEKYLYIATKEWIRKDSINFYKESQKVLTQAACEWCGVPLKDKEIDKRTEQLISMIESPVAVSKRHIEGRIGRIKGEKWVSGLIEQVREGTLQPDEDTALYQIAWHKELDGELLDLKTAAVELLNVIRPSVAIALYFAFTALTLQQFPEEKNKLNGENPYYLHMFIQEIRRYYPFFPFNGAITRTDFIWNGYQFEKDTLTIFDFYGTNHDPRVWEDPEDFKPERFSNWHESPTDQIQFRLLAQGGGSYSAGHRCPGEWNTVRAMEIITDFLVNKIDYTVPEQDVGFSLVNMPTTPKSGMIFENIQYKG